VISRFVKAFENPEGQENIEFWGKVAHFHEGGSGPSWISGWITAFCVFDSKGRWIGAPFTQGYLEQLTLDGVYYHRVDLDKIPPGFAEVDVKLIDHGKILQTVLVAGLAGAVVCDSGDKDLSENGMRDTAKPLVAWWMFIKAE